MGDDATYAHSAGNCFPPPISMTVLRPFKNDFVVTQATSRFVSRAPTLVPSVAGRASYHSSVPGAKSPSATFTPEDGRDIPASEAFNQVTKTACGLRVIHLWEQHAKGCTRAATEAQLERGDGRRQGRVQHVVCLTQHAAATFAFHLVGQVLHS